MRRWARPLGTVLIVAGVLTLAWAVVVWQWQDPFTALYTKWRQHQLASQYEKRVQAYQPPAAGSSAAAERQTIARSSAASEPFAPRGR